MTDKLKKILDFIREVMIQSRTGKLEINFSQGGITHIAFTEIIKIPK